MKDRHGRLVQERVKICSRHAGGCAHVAGDDKAPEGPGNGPAASEGPAAPEESWGSERAEGRDMKEAWKVATQGAACGRRLGRGPSIAVGGELVSY